MYILIVNEDPLGRSLAATLVKHGHEVAYLDENAEYCEMVAAELGCLVIQGETTNIRVLQEAGIERADVLVTLLDKDAKNIIVGIFGRQFHVPRILAWLRQQHYRSAYELAGIEYAISAFDYLHNELLVAIEEPNVRHIMALGDGRMEIIAIEVTKNSPFNGQEISTIWHHPDYPKDALILGLLKVESQTVYLTKERPKLEVGDDVLAAGPVDDVQTIAQILLTESRHRLLDWMGR